MTDWPGHSPTTSSALLSLMLRARRGNTEFSRAQRVLFTVCEFRAAAMHGALRRYLGSTAAAQLEIAEACYRALGLTGTAAVLRRNRVRLLKRPSAELLTAAIADLETSLARLREPVDETIARFAGELTLEWNDAPSGQSLGV